MAPFHVHIGLPKTGSTTFQNALRQNAAQVSETVHVVNRMQPGVERKGLLRAHAYLRQSYRSGVDPDVLATHLETALGSPLSEPVQARPVLITDEGLSGPHPGQFKAHGGIFPALNTALDALGAVLPKGRVVFHIVIRETAAWIKSLYNQAVKQTGYTNSFEQFATMFPAGFDLGAHIAEVRAAHADKDIRVHRMEDHSLFPGEQILTACGVGAQTLAALTLPETQNQSWSPAMLQAMRVINGAAIDEKSRNILRREIARQRDVFAGG